MVSFSLKVLPRPVQLIQTSDVMKRWHGQGLRALKRNWRLCQLPEGNSNDSCQTCSWWWSGRDGRGKFGTRCGIIFPPSLLKLTYGNWETGKGLLFSSFRTVRVKARNWV